LVHDLGRAVKLGTSSTVDIGWISNLRTTDLGAGEAAESIAEELEATATAAIGLISKLRPDVLAAEEAV
jgi:hypothetical protein